MYSPVQQPPCILMESKQHPAGEFALRPSKPASLPAQPDSAYSTQLVSGLSWIYDSTASGSAKQSEVSGTVIFVKPPVSAQADVLIGIHRPAVREARERIARNFICLSFIRNTFYAEVSGNGWPSGICPRRLYESFCIQEVEFDIFIYRKKVLLILFAYLFLGMLICRRKFTILSAIQFVEDEYIMFKLV
ncbi:hypothetical protein F4805DRAFT_297462 [Annulohypoxylon moriforme]|nr:hypothetical protein F4805DRAFT_297462 [Annulohypoxylon moriforme]